MPHPQHFTVLSIISAHVVVRATEDVDVLVTREGLERFKTQLLGRGYVNLRPGRKAVRDTANGVKVDFLVTGDYPGDGKPKPVAFPIPSAVATDVGASAWWRSRDSSSSSSPPA